MKMQTKLIILSYFIIGTICLEKPCRPGESKKQDCNSCTCIDTGNNMSAWRCTKIWCGKPCTPGAVFQEECNVCICNLDGGSAACTLKNCPEETCIPGETKKKHCNSCVCISYGNTIEWRCTKIPCHGEIYRKPCIPGDVFPNDCNICICNSDGVTSACTLNNCP